MRHLLMPLLFLSCAEPKPMNKTPPAPIAFTRGPAIADAAVLKSWLDQQKGKLRLPVAVELVPVRAVGNARIGSLELKLDDTALNVSLADRAYQQCPRDGGPCVLWLEGRWKGDGAFQVTRVDRAVRDGESTGFAEVEAGP